MILLCNSINKILCKYYNLFGKNKVDNITLDISNGIVSLNGFTGHTDDVVFLCANNSYSDNNKLGKEVLYGKQILNTATTFKIAQKYITQTLSNNSIITDFRIYSVINEVVAFEIFKMNINNYIFIIPSVGKNTNISQYGDVHITDYYQIIIMLNNNNDINQMQNISKVIEIRDYIISILFHNYKFENSDFVFGTENTTILKSTFSKTKNINSNLDDISYLIDFKNPTHDNLLDK